MMVLLGLVQLQIVARGLQISVFIKVLYPWKARGKYFNLAFCLDYDLLGGKFKCMIPGLSLI